VFRYIKAAFFVRAPVPALGQVPVNLLGVIAFGILGVADPSFWLLGAGLETLFIFSLATNARFQKVVDAEQVRAGDGDAETKRRNLVATLPAELQKRLAILQAKCGRVQEIFRNQQAEQFVLEANQDSLERLEWVYLKLLVAHHNLTAPASADTAASLGSKIAALEAELKTGRDSEALRQSRSATLAILRERLTNIGRRQESLAEIESDMTRIEAQVDLMIENATIQGKPQTIATDIELATNLAGGAIFGDSGSAVADLDETFSAPHRPAPRAPERN
jgi:hypothetical protein